MVSWCARATELGGGYNEQIANLNNSIIAKSGVKWVRAYVNLPRNYLTFGEIENIDPPGLVYPIVGAVEGNITQPLAAVSSDADVLAIAALDQLINAKSVVVGGGPVKVILSLKHDFSYPYPVGQPIPANGFPDWDTPEGKAEIEVLLTTIKGLLTTHNRGNAIDIIVTGNEPMFEIQPNTSPETAANYGKYLNVLISQLDAWKQEQNLLAGNNWKYQIFVGALNSPIPPPDPLLPELPNQILPVVLNVAQTNPLVDGLDLHEHVMDPREARSDIRYVKSFLRSDQKIISTEFSIIKLLAANQNEPLGSWGPLNGYGRESADWPMYQWINTLMERVGNGRAVSREKFLSFFNTRSWYPKSWFRTMFEIFEDEGLYAVTYGLEEVPRYPWQLNKLDGTSLPWALNAAYNATILGRSKDGCPQTNPLVFPEFRNAIDRRLFPNR